MESPRAIAGRTLGLLDLTDLGDNSSQQSIEDLCRRAVTPHGPVAAVCIWPRFVKLARTQLVGSGVRVATVANFPGGEPDAAEAAVQTLAAFEDGADEVDVVIPWRSILSGDHAIATELVSACREKVPSGRRLKVILETGELGTGSMIETASRLAIEAGADFIKTSTGKVPVNATPEAARVMISSIRDSGRSIGFKAAGGIRTTRDAGDYLMIADEIMGAGWVSPETFRFGASGLLDDLLAVLQGKSGDGADTGGY